MSDSKKSKGGGGKRDRRSVLNQLFFLKAIWKAPHLLPQPPSLLFLLLRRLSRSSCLLTLILPRALLSLSVE